MILAETPILAMTIVPRSDRLEQHLRTWADWLSAPDGPDGLPCEACVGENYQSLDRESDGAYERLDHWIAENVQAVVEGIGERAPAQKAALYRAYGIVSVFRFPRGNYEDVLREAKTSVAIGLRRRGVWLGD